MDKNEIGGLVQTLQKYSSGVILLPVNPTADTVAAATALYLGLSKTGKNVSMASAEPVKSDMTASDKITHEIGTSGDNLVISFPYQEGSIDKVDYNITGDKFNLIITPHPGQPKLDPKQVNYSNSGGKIEFIIAIDAPSLRSLGPIYQQNQKELQNKLVINIDRHLANSYYGQVNIVAKNVSSTSEIVLQILNALQVELDPEIATNLYAGIMQATNNFGSYSVTAATFETAAQLLKSGAKKRQGAAQARPAAFGQRARGAQPNYAPQPTQRPQPVPLPTQQDARPIEDIEDEIDDIEDEDAPDWLKPRIFGGSGQGTSENQG